MRSLSGRPAYAVAVVALLVLAGCGGSGTTSTDQPTGAPASSSAPTTAPQADRTVVAEPEDGAPIFESEDSVSTGDDALPDGFPVAKIPLVGGRLVGGSKGKADAEFAYTVLKTVKEPSVARVMADVTRRLTRAGFRAEPGATTAAISSSTFKNAAYDVGVNVIRSEGTTTVTYVVVQH